MSAVFPWRQIFRVALLNGLAPDDVWHMTAGEVYGVLARGMDTGSLPPVTPEILAALTRLSDENEIADNLSDKSKRQAA